MSASNPPTSSVPLGLEQVLKHFFGYDSLIPGQQEIVEAALQKRDMMIVMPTGSGKSLYFQLLALLKLGLIEILLTTLERDPQELGDDFVRWTAQRREHFNESSQASNWSFEVLLLRGSLAARKEEEGRNQKKCFYKYEMLPQRLATYLEKSTAIKLSGGKVRRIVKKKKYVYIWAKSSLDPKKNPETRTAF
ncbi:DEAD/DEAH box helicase [Microcoleus sp. K1-B6]|uniref:DEAD/DEAH box helicase n=1 Tax=unclassified Microcoleus TaxID=2642155 RepID=UPI002FD65610